MDFEVDTGAVDEDTWSESEVDEYEYEKVLKRLDCRFHLRLLPSLCSSLCCPPWPPRIIKKLAFGFCAKSTYQFAKSETGENKLRLSNDAKLLIRYDFKDRLPEWLLFIRHTLIPGLQCFRIPYGKHLHLACIRYQHEWDQWPIILFSKARGQDIGMSLMQTAKFVGILGMDVFVYDYCGYGLSDDKLTERNLYGNVECVYQYITETLGIPWNKIIAFGASLGTMATIHLASKYPVGGVILEGSFMSALRTCCPRLERTCYSCDRLDSLAMIHEVQSPTLFVHGSKDEMFGVEHMERLRDNCPGAANIEPLVVEGAGHLTCRNYFSYWARLNAFIQEETQVMAGTDRRVVLKDTGDELALSTILKIDGDESESTPLLERRQ